MYASNKLSKFKFIWECKRPSRKTTLTSENEVGGLEGILSYNDQNSLIFKIDNWTILILFSGTEERIQMYMDNWFFDRGT